MEECALREVEEETGLRCQLGGAVGIVEIVGADDGDLHRWHLYLLKAVGGTFRENPETNSIAWLNVEAAARQVTYENFRQLLRSWAPRLRQLAETPVDDA